MESQKPSTRETRSSDEMAVCFYTGVGGWQTLEPGF
jgi:hypothetical protein